jgi:uncharacterized protein (DUF3084 family)
MNKIKEDLLLSIIFLAKWLLLIIGIITILSVAVSFPFDKYHDKLIGQIDVKIDRLGVKQQVLEKNKNRFKKELELVKNELAKLEPYNISSASKKISKILYKLKRTWQPNERKRIKQELSKAKEYLKKVKKRFYKLPEQSQEIMEDKFDSFWNKIKNLDGSIKSTSKKIQEIEKKIRKARNKKRDKELDIFSCWDIIKWLLETFA